MEISLLLCSQPDRPIIECDRKSKMNATPSLLIHELLPCEIMRAIFEEHAKLEWGAPTMDKCVISGERLSSILHERGHILQYAMTISGPARVNCACGSIDPAQRLFRLTSAGMTTTALVNCTIYSVIITQEPNLCKCGTPARLSSKDETFYACDF